MNVASSSHFLTPGLLGVCRQRKDHLSSTAALWTLFNKLRQRVPSQTDSGFVVAGGKSPSEVAARFTRSWGRRGSEPWRTELFHGVIRPDSLRIILRCPLLVQKQWLSVCTVLYVFRTKIIYISSCFTVKKMLLRNLRNGSVS